MHWKFLADGSFGDPAFNLWPEFAAHPERVEEGSPPMLKVHIRPLVNLPERGGFGHESGGSLAMLLLGGVK